MKVGNYSIKKEPKHSVQSILGKVALGFLGYIIVRSLPDLARYVKISRM